MDTARGEGRNKHRSSKQRCRQLECSIASIFCITSAIFITAREPMLYSIVDLPEFLSASQTIVIWRIGADAAIGGPAGPSTQDGARRP